MNDRSDTTTETFPNGSDCYWYCDTEKRLVPVSEATYLANRAELKRRTSGSW